MDRRHSPSPGLPLHLAQLYDRFPFDRSLADDPLSCVRPFATSPRSGEVAGIVAATLAIGNTTAIRGAFDRFAAHLDHDFASFAEGRRAGTGASEVGGFKHRWIRGDQMAYLGRRLQRVYDSYPTLEQVFLEGWEEGDGFAAGLHAVSRALRGPAREGTRRPPRGYPQLFPSPKDEGASACKRLTLFVRWMTRERYPDLGLWRGVPTGELRVPLDQHVFWIAYHIGLTRRRTRNWLAVEEVTEALRRIDPLDPIRYDFVLCHTGISGDCPKERDLAVCGPCTLRPDCALWRGRPAA